MILTITGPSGSGKTTLLGGIRTHYPEARPLESVTTRPPRTTDIPGEYREVSNTEFEKMLRGEEFLWHVSVHGYRFGTRKVAIEAALAEGFFVAILVSSAVEILHAHTAQLGKSEALRSVYLYLEDETELRRRLEERGDTPDIERRITECRSWNDKAHAATYPLYILDASQDPKEILRHTLMYLS